MATKTTTPIVTITTGNTGTQYGTRTVTIPVTKPENFDPRNSIRTYTEGQEAPKLERYVSLYEQIKEG